MALKPKLIELRIVKGAEFRLQATKAADKPELRNDDVNDETKSDFLCELEAILGFTFHPCERISRRKKLRVQLVATISRKCEISDFVCGVERAAH